MWRKGWCRNPLLFSPQQSHLVNDEDLDCERGMGNYWESMEPITTPEPASLATGFDESVSMAFTSKAPKTQLVSEIGNPVYPVMGAAGQGGDRPPYDDPPGDGWSGGEPPNPSGREYNYYPEERYWTDYLRIAAPIFGVILMVFLFWWWVTNFIGDDDPEDGTIAGNATSTVTISTIGETPDPSAPPVETEGTPSGGVVFPTTPPAGEGTDPPIDETEDPEVPSGIYNGATVEVFNTGGTGVNVRTQPTTDSEIISVFLDGTVLTVIGEATGGEGFTWWPVVSTDGIEGYVVQEYLSLIE